MASSTVDYDALAKKYGAISSAPADTAPTALDYDALAKQHGAISSSGTTPQVSSSIRYLATEDYPKESAPKPQQGLIPSFAEWAIKPFVDLGSAIGSVNPADYMKAGQTIADFGNMLIGEPKRIWNDLVRSGDAMRKGDAPTAAYHLGGAFPMLGEPAKQITQEIAEGRYQDAAGHYLALIVPGMAEKGLPRVGAAIETARVAVPGAIRGGLEAVTQRPPVGAALLGEILGGPKGAAVAATVAKTPAVVRGVVSGARGALADAAAAEAAAAEAARVAAIENPPPGFTILSPDYFNRFRELPPGAVITPEPPAPPDTSFVRGVPAMYPTGPNPARALPPGPSRVLVTPPPEVPPEVTPPITVPGQYPEVLPQSLRSSTAAETQARALEAALRPEMVYDYLVRNKVPTEMLDRFTDESWRLVTEQAGLKNPPTQAEQAVIRQRLAEYEGAATMTEPGQMTPAEATAAFEQKKAIRTRARRKPAAQAETTTPTPETAPSPLQSQLAESIEMVKAGERPTAQPGAAEGPKPATASETRVERIARHLAEDENITLADLETMPDNPNSLAMLEKLGRALEINGRPTAAEIPQIIERIRELRGAQSQTLRVELPPEVSKMPPAQAEEAFQTAKTKRTRRAAAKRRRPPPER